MIDKNMTNSLTQQIQRIGKNAEITVKNVIYLQKKELKS